MSTKAHPEMPEQAVWVVFTGRADLVWLRLLRRGFRHCFLAMHDGERWTTLDPLASRLVVGHPPVEADFDLPGFYRGVGLRVLGPFVPRAPEARWLPPLAPLSCVTVVLRVLGLRRALLLTPWQLYRFLRRHGKEQNPRKITLTSGA